MVEHQTLELRPDMTEKLFNGTLSKNETKHNKTKIPRKCFCYTCILITNRISNGFLFVID